MKGMPDDICIVRYDESFGGAKQLLSRNQMHLFNRDGSISKETL